MRRWLSAVSVRVTSIAILVGLLATPGGGLGRPRPTEAAQLGLPFFGVALSSSPGPNAPAEAADLKAGFASVLFSWSELQPAEGAWDEAAQARLDQRVAELNAGGVRVVAQVAAAPTWAAFHLNGPLRPGKSDAYVSFLARLVARYSTAPFDVHHWLLWNEPDAVMTPKVKAWADRGAWGDSGAAFADLMRQSYAQIKAADPAAVVILGPIAYDFFDDPPPNDPAKAVGGSSPGFNSGGLFKYGFLDDVLSRLRDVGGGPAFDAIGVNAYVGFSPGWEFDAARNGRPGTDVAAKIGQLRSRLGAYGLDVPILIGEAGFWSSGPTVVLTDGRGNPVPPGDDAVGLDASPRAQAEYVAKLYARALDAGVAGVAWFSLEEVDPAQGYGLVGASGPKDAYRAYQWAASVLGDATRGSATDGVAPAVPDAVEAYAFDGGKGRVAVAWAKLYPGMTRAQALAPRARVAVAPGARAYDLFGQPMPSVGADDGGRAFYDLTASPVFFVWPPS